MFLLQELQGRGPPVSGNPAHFGTKGLQGELHGPAVSEIFWHVEVGKLEKQHTFVCIHIHVYILYRCCYHVFIIGLSLG